MPENTIPYLCGGVLFFLMAHMKPSAGTARDHQSGLKDDHSDPAVMQNLIYAVKGSEYTTAAKDTSNYRECKNNGSVNVPFNDVALCSSYDNAVKNDYSDTLKRMSEFVQSHLDLSKKEWFIKVLLDIIENDADIAETDEFDGRILYLVQRLTENQSNHSLYRRIFFACVPGRHYALHPCKPA